MFGLYHIRTRSAKFCLFIASVNVISSISLLFCFTHKGFLHNVLYILSDVTGRCVFHMVTSGNPVCAQRYRSTFRKIYSQHNEYSGQLWIVTLVTLCYQLLSAYKKLVVFPCIDYLNYEIYNTDNTQHTQTQTHNTDNFYKHMSYIYTFNTRIYRYNTMIISNMTITLLFTLITYNILFTMAKVQYLQCLLVIFNYLFTMIYFNLLFTITFIQLLFLIFNLYNVFYILALSDLSFIYCFELQFVVMYSTYLEYLHGIIYYDCILSPLTIEKTSTFYVRNSASLFCRTFHYFKYA